MPKARIITRNSAAVFEVAQALGDSGYEVEIVSPDSIPNSPADLELNLRTDAAEILQPLESDSYEYDVPIEREFILAPAWRALVSRLKDHWTRLHPQRPIEKDLPPVIIEEIAPAQPKRSLRLNAYLSAAKGHAHDLIAKVPDLISRTRNQTNSLIASARPHFAQFATVSRNRATQVRESMSSWRNRMPRSEAKIHVPAIAAPTRDYLWHQSWPIAAGVVFAFLLGWFAATQTNTPAKQVLQPAAVMPVVSQGVIPARHLQKPRAQRKVLQATVTRKPSAVRNSRSNVDTNTVTEDEVVTRHYPSKTVTAQNRQQQHPKRYSDLD